MPKKFVFGRFSVSRPSLLCLTFGTYAVLCQVSMILLFALAVPENVASDVLRHWILPWLEYPLMSLALLLGGALLIDYVQK